MVLSPLCKRKCNVSAAYFEGIESNQALELNPEQKQACEAVVGAIGKQQPPFLLQGITGSGKTEVTCRLSKVPWTRARQLFCWCLRFP